MTTEKQRHKTVSLELCVLLALLRPLGSRKDLHQFEYISSLEGLFLRLLTKPFPTFLFSFSFAFDLMTSPKDFNDFNWRKDDDDDYTQKK